MIKIVVRRYLNNINKKVNFYNMGNSLCCSHDVFNDLNDGVIPIDTRKKST